MGVSTDAILFYGYCWDEEDVRNPWEIGRESDDEDDASDTSDKEEEEDDDDWEKRYARLKGCLPPSTPFPTRTVTPTRENGWSSTPKDYTAAEQEIIDQHTAHWRARREIADASPCLVATHCSASCPMAYVAVKASVTCSSRGNPHEIASLIVDPSWRDQLAEFCEVLGIKTSGMKAAWWLVSDWGE